MNSNDRFIMSKVYQAINKMTNIGSSNPCDIGSLAKLKGRVNTASTHLLHALNHLQYQEYGDAGGEADRAIKALENSQ